jgi:hypothetical protein
MPTQVKEQKVRFTVWLNPAVLSAAKARANRDRISVSEVLARAAQRELGQGEGGDADALIHKAVDRVFFLLQRTDKRRGFENQVLKEMVGLAVLAFFNHTPPVPDADRKAAHLSGNVRFQQFLDAVAANLRRGRSVLAELPDADADSQPSVSETNGDSAGNHAQIATEDDLKPPTPKQVRPQPIDPVTKPEVVDAPLQKRQSSVTAANTPAKRWGLFG